MARRDAIGLFWQDTPGKEKRKRPKIKSKWKAKSPTDWPNFRHVKTLGLDTETFDPNLKTHGPGWARHDGHIVGISVSTKNPRESIYFPIRHTVKPKQNCDPDKVLLWCKDNLEQHACSNRLVIGAKLQYDLGWLKEEGVKVSGDFLDIQIVEKLIDEHRYQYNLDSLARKYLKQGKVSDKLYKWCAEYYGGPVDGTQRKNIYKAPPALVGPYAEGDAWQPLKIWKKQKKIIKAQNLQRVLDLECKLIPILIRMRFRGVRIDVEHTEMMRERLLRMENALQRTLNNIAGRHTRVNAPRDIAKSFDSLGIKYAYTEEGNPSFTKLLLQSCKHPIAKVILKLREVTTIRSTFVENALLDKHVNGRVYCSFNQLGAKQTGRFSSSNPNMQQIPSRTHLGKALRACFIPDEGFTHWYRYDYSQIEYRHLAHHAVGEGSDEIRRRYNKDPNTDYHKAVIELIHNIVNVLLERKPAKTINFGLCYGMGIPKLRASLKLTKKKSDKLFRAYHTGVPFVSATFEHFMNLALHYGYVVTALGRRGRFPLWEEAWSKDGPLYKSRIQAIRATGSSRVQRAMTHKALNKVLQGGAADHMKSAMVALDDAGIYDALGGVPSLTVHDELDGSTNFDTKIEVHREMKHIMEECFKLNVPVIADAEIGTNWRDCKKFDFKKEVFA